MEFIDQMKLVRRYARGQEAWTPQVLDSIHAVQIFSLKNSEELKNMRAGFTGIPDPKELRVWAEDVIDSYIENYDFAMTDKKGWRMLAEYCIETIQKKVMLV